MTHSIATEEIEKLAAENSDREIYCGPFSDPPGSYYADKIFTTKDGRIGFNVGGRVVVQPLRDWFELACAAQRRPGKEEIKRAIADGYSNGNEQFDEMSSAAQLRCEMAADAVVKLFSTPSVDDAAEVDRLRKELEALTVPDQTRVIVENYFDIGRELDAVGSPYEAVLRLKAQLAAKDEALKIARQYVEGIANPIDARPGWLQADADLRTIDAALSTPAELTTTTWMKPLAERLWANTCAVCFHRGEAECDCLDEIMATLAKARAFTKAEEPASNG